MLYVQFWALDDGRKNHLKHADCLSEINKLWNVASCWLYSADVCFFWVWPTASYKAIYCSSQTLQDNVYWCYLNMNILKGQNYLSNAKLLVHLSRRLTIIIKNVNTSWCTMIYIRQNMTLACAQIVAGVDLDVLTYFYRMCIRADCNQLTN